MRLNPIRSIMRWQPIGALIACLFSLTSSPVWGHEMWVEASRSIVKPGVEVSLNLYVGQNFKGDELVYNPRRFIHYKVVTSTTERPIPGHYGDSPAGRVKAVAAGLNIVSYLSQHQQIRFDDAAKWQQYLKYEGLRETAQVYRQKGFPQQGIREHFQRCARALIWGAPQAETQLLESDQQDRPTGMPLELISLDLPFTSSSNTFNFQLIYLSKPIADVQVRVFYRSPDKKVPVKDAIARTAQDGTVTLPRFGPGRYLFNAVHLTPAAQDRQAEWQSYWASLSLTLK